MLRKYRKAVLGICFMWASKVVVNQSPWHTKWGRDALVSILNLYFLSYLFGAHWSRIGRTLASCSGGAMGRGQDTPRVNVCHKGWRWWLWRLVLPVEMEGIHPSPCLTTLLHWGQSGAKIRSNLHILNALLLPLCQICQVEPSTSSSPWIYLAWITQVCTWMPKSLTTDNFLPHSWISCISTGHLFVGGPTWRRWSPANHDNDIDASEEYRGRHIPYRKQMLRIWTQSPWI